MGPHRSVDYNSLVFFYFQTEMVDQQEKMDSKSPPTSSLDRGGNRGRKNVVIVDEQPQTQKSGCCGGS